MKNETHYEMDFSLLVRFEKVIHTGEAKREKINYALTETFGNPIMYVEKFSQNVDMNNPKEERADIIQLKSENSINIQKDDFDW